MTREEMEKELWFANMIIGVIQHVNTPMLMCQGEKDVVKKALYEYVDKLESELREMIEQNKVPSIRPCKDCISRADAIAAIKNLYPDMPVMDIMNARRKWQKKYSQYIECEKEIEKLSSVQPKIDR